MERGGNQAGALTTLQTGLHRNHALSQGSADGHPPERGSDKNAINQGMVCSQPASIRGEAIDVCQFNYLTLPIWVDADIVRPIVRGFGKNLDLVAEHGLNALIDKGDALYSTCTISCDCGSCIGSAWRPPAVADDLDAKAAKLATKGWSKSKIARWRADKVGVQTRDEDRQRELSRRKSPEAQMWCDLIGTCVRVEKANCVGLIHTWEGGSGRELREGFRSSDLRLETLTSDFVLTLEPFHLYRFRA